MDKTSTSTKKNVFHEHIILLIEGRFLAFLSIGILAAIWFGMIKDILKVQSINEASQWVSQNLLSILGILLFTVLEIIFLWEFWYRFFGRLFITENEIIWKCPFMKTRRLNQTEVKYAGFDYRFSSGSLRNITTVDMVYFRNIHIPRSMLARATSCETVMILLNSTQAKSCAFVCRNGCRSPAIGYSQLRTKVFSGKKTVVAGIDGSADTVG